MNRPVLLLVILLIPVLLAAQEDTVLHESRDVLAFGIDSEVLELLDRLEDQGEDRLDEEISTRFAESRNRSLQGRILEHFEKREVAAAGPAVSAIVIEDEELDAAFLRTAVRYLSVVADVHSPELLERYAEIARDDDIVAASVAIGAIGTDATPGAVELLLELFEDSRSVDLKGAVIRALGTAKAGGAVEMLARIVTDPYEDSSLRQYGAESLGKIGAPESLEPLVSVLADSNSLLRAYAIAALGNYDDPTSAQALNDGLRDSFWRVRVAALQGIATRGATDSLQAIEYKARRDPEAPVRQQAIRTLAALNTDEAFVILREISTNPRSAQADRILSVELLVQDDLATSLDTISEVLDSEWAVENSRLLDATARALVRTDSDQLAGVYERMLSHPNFIVRVYAIRGIGNSGLGEYGPELQRIYTENPTGILRSATITALQKLEIPLPVEDTDTSDGSDSESAEADVQADWNESGSE
jgi:HEAT repeat protein